MPALRDILKKEIRLIDYELIKENKVDNPQRLVAFGRYAGCVGAIDFLQGFGDFLMYKKTYTPFLHTGFSYMYPNLDLAKERIQKVGGLLKKKHIDPKLRPLIFAITGNGRVSNGAQEILELLPHEWVEPDDLHTLFSNKVEVKSSIVYLTKIEHKHMYCQKSETSSDHRTFDKTHFYKHKGEYKSVFAEKYLPFISALFHCMYWDAESPVIISDQEARTLSLDGRLRLVGITDITCDFPVSSIQLLKMTTTIANPFYSIDPKNGAVELDFKKMSSDAVLYHAVDHLPSELPFDSSNHFSEKLLPFVKAIIESQYPDRYEQKNLPREIFNACETWGGELCPSFRYLYKELEKYYSEFKDFSGKLE